MPSHFSTIGMPLENPEQYRMLVMTAAQQGARVAGSEGRFIRYTPGAGVELWVQVGQGNVLLGCNPHFAGQGRMRVGVTQVLPNKDHPHDGSLHGWANPFPGDPGIGQYPLLIDVPDFALVQERLSPPQAVDMQIAAFAHDLRCFATDTQFYDERDHSLAAESFIPSGLFYPEGEARQPLVAEAIFNGHILATEIRTNPATQRSFHWLLVQTLDATIDVVADPVLVIEAPRVGGVAQGSFWLSGRVLDG